MSNRASDASISSGGDSAITRPQNSVSSETTALMSVSFRPTSNVRNRVRAACPQCRSGSLDSVQEIQDQFGRREHCGDVDLVQVAHVDLLLSLENPMLGEGLDVPVLAQLAGRPNARGLKFVDSPVLIHAIKGSVDKGMLVALKGDLGIVDRPAESKLDRRGDNRLHRGADPHGGCGRLVGQVPLLCRGKARARRVQNGLRPATTAASEAPIPEAAPFEPVRSAWKVDYLCHPLTP